MRSFQVFSTILMLSVAVGCSNSTPKCGGEDVIGKLRGVLVSQIKMNITRQMVLERLNPSGRILTQDELELLSSDFNVMDVHIKDLYDHLLEYKSNTVVKEILDEINNKLKSTKIEFNNMRAVSIDGDIKKATCIANAVYFNDDAKESEEEVKYSAQKTDDGKLLIIIAKK